MTTSSELIAALRSVLDARRDREADARPSRIVGRNTDGTAKIKRLDSECVGRGGMGGYSGEIVVQLPALDRRRGTSGAALGSMRGTAVTLWVERIDPYWLERGASGVTVEVYGAGFTATTVLEFLKPGTREINADITITNQVLVSSTRITLTVDVSGSADLFEEAALAYG